MSKSILIIDDENEIREVTATSLEMMAGWKTITVSGGELGLRVAQTEKLDLILLDVMMPEMDGPATLRRLREQPRSRQVPVVFLSAKAQSFEQAELRELGVAGVIAKPFDPVTLHEQIAALLKW
jgi:DNA-binding response OmpR family regulator